MKYSFLFPVYNAESLLNNTYRQIKTFADTLDQDYEIIFWDDGSRDESVKKLAEISKLSKSVFFGRNDRNRGLGFTLRKLFDKAQGEIVIYCDCDLPFGIEGIEKLIAKIPLADIVVASRYQSIGPEVSWIRQRCSRMYYFLMKCLFAITVKDIGSGTVAFRSDVLKGLNLSRDGFDIHTEIFVKASDRKFQVMEVAAQSFSQKYSTFKILKHGPKVILSTLKFWLDNNKKEVTV